MDDFNKKKAIAVLCQWLLEHRYFDFQRLQQKAPKDITQQLSAIEQIERMVDGLNIQELIEAMGMASWKENTGSIPADWFKWNR